MSDGHTARVIEEPGIPTVCVYIRAFRHEAEALKPPRTLLTRHILGRTVGAPGDADGQRGVVRAAIRLLETAEAPGTIAEAEESPYARAEADARAGAPTAG